MKGGNGAMLYNRQKEVLYLIAKLKRVGRVKIQKLEFMACLNSQEPSYEFIPYNYGPYSLTLQNDLDYLCREEFLAYSNTQYGLATDVIPALDPIREAHLDRTLSKYGRFGSRELMREIYLNHPEYAVNSLRANDLLTNEEYLRVQQCKPQTNSPRIFTIGYEGKSLEGYLSQLYEHGITLLIDVRSSSYSMKKEFIGSRLASGCKLLDIDYLHIPELGIPNQYRKAFQDRQILFRLYQEEFLPQCTREISRIAEILNRYSRIALTCFEAQHTDCHRYYLAQRMYEYLGGLIPVEHCKSCT
jgi:uncharacterized protein (DUF488 family)